MKFFKPTSIKILIAVILTIWPYVVSFIYVNKRGEGDVFSDTMVRSAFWYHAWEWSPLYLIIHSFSHSLLIILGQSNFFIFFVYPILRFSIRYLVACGIVFFISKLLVKRVEKTYS